MSEGIDALRLLHDNQRPIQAEGDYVLYWMSTSRRLQQNAGLDHAVALCQSLQKPLVIFEAIRIGYPHANLRHHRFVIDGMRDHAKICEQHGIRYLPYIENEAGAGRGLVARLSQSACALVGDAAPGGWLDRATQSALKQVSCAGRLIDSVGLIPLAYPDKLFRRAFDLRRFVARELPIILASAPRDLGLDDPVLANAPLPSKLDSHYALDQSRQILEDPSQLGALPLDHAIAETTLAGGVLAAQQQWRSFLSQRLSRYGDERHHPDAEVESRMAPYLHYGQISSHRLLWDILETHDLSPQEWVENMREHQSSAEDRWTLDPGANGFVDQLLVWREIGQLWAHRQPDFEHYDSLPEWARKSLSEHQCDPRPALYTFEELEEARSEDPLWNAAQRQLVEEGHIHNYLRMLWGKRVMAWTKDPKTAYDWLVKLNNRYALDGRDPNSYAGIGWVFGLFDRPWGPERPIYGKIRYMTSQSAMRKLRLREYLSHWGQAHADPTSPQGALFSST